MSKRNVPLAPAPGELAEGGPQAGRAVPKLQKNERPGPARRPSMAAWGSLLIVWLGWGGTSLAIRGGGGTLPPLLGAGGGEHVPGHQGGRRDDSAVVAGGGAERGGRPDHVPARPAEPPGGCPCAGRNLLVFATAGGMGVARRR